MASEPLREHPSTSEGASFWRAAAERPDALALVTPEGEQISFSEVAAEVNRTSHGLRALGVTENDVVAVCLPNGKSFFILVLATAQIGVHVVPVNWHLSGAEIHYIVENSGASVLVASDPAQASAIQTAGAVPDHRYIDCDSAPGGWLALDELSAGRSSDLPAGRTGGELMGYTSGTTGRPKGVRWNLTSMPPEQSLAPILAMARGLGYGGDSGAHLVCSPSYHTAPLVFALASLHLGHAVIVHHGFDPELVLSDIERFDITETHMVPTHFHRLLQLPRSTREAFDVSSLRTVLHAGAACPVHVKQAMIEWFGPVLWEYLGATEGVVSIVGSEEWLQHPGTVGRPMPGVQVELLDDNDVPVPAGEAGTIYYSPPAARFEYHGDLAKTQASRKGDLCTVGDIGRFDQDGFLYVLDRRVDLIVSGGVNIYPAEIEGHLLSHPAVSDAIVFGVPDDAWGTSAVAVVSPLAGADADQVALKASLIDHCGDGLAGYKRPRHLEIGDVPRTPNGKLLRRQAREEYLGRARRT